MTDDDENIFLRTIGRGQNDSDRHEQGRHEEDGLALWRHVTRSVTPLDDSKTIPGDDTGSHSGRGKTQDTGKRAGHRMSLPPPSAKTLSDTSPPRATPPGVDARTEKRFRQGKMTIDATLDLHGMTQADAHGALKQFIARGYGRGWRCVLVITGKGGRHRGKEEPPAHWLAPEARGVLKRKVPDWLGRPPLRSLVLRAAPAKKRHGGSGALYVLIRRKR